MDRITLEIYAGLSFTKFILYQGKKPLLYHRINHIKEDIDRYISIVQRVEYKSKLVLNTIKNKGFDCNRINKVISGAREKIAILDNIGGFIKNFKIEERAVYIRDNFYRYSELITDYISRVIGTV